MHSSPQNRNDVCNGNAAEAKITTSGNQFSMTTPQNFSPPTPNLPDVDIPLPGSSHPLTPYALSPPLVFIIGALGSIFLVIGYYQIMLKYCSSIERLVNRRSNRQSAIQTTYDGPNLNTGLDPSIIARIPIRHYNSKDADSDTECSVCLADFSDGETVRVLPKCRHAFHISCIGVWLNSHSTCPLCRADVEMGFFNPLLSERKDEQNVRPSPRIESQVRSASLRLNTNSQLGNVNVVGNVRRARSLTRGDFPETELSSSQWYRLFVWSRRVTSPSRVRLFTGEPSGHDSNKNNNEPSLHEVVIDLGEPSHGGNAKSPVCNGGEIRD